MFNCPECGYPMGILYDKDAGIYLGECSHCHQEWEVRAEDDGEVAIAIKRKVQ
jgi:transcription elongation factor Elf1